MFIGHYGPAFGAKAALPRLPLWVLFIAVQFMDVCCMTLMILGIEKARIVPGLTEGAQFDAYYMPYSHSLEGALVLSVVYGGLVALFFPRERKQVFLIAALAVFSHWILDLLVHVPDLPLWGNSLKVGFGLWRHLWISLPLELGLLLAGALLYVRYVPARQGKYRVLDFYSAARRAADVRLLWAAALRRNLGSEGGTIYLRRTRACCRRR